MNILITATTYPRYQGDTIPGFVHHFARELARQSWVDEVHVLAPHAPGIERYEVMDGVHVHRYRYWPNEKGETITYGGAVHKMKKTPLYAIKLASLLLCQLMATYRVTSRHSISLINAHWLIPMGTIATIIKLLTRVPFVATIHGSDIFGLNHGAIKIVKRWTLKSADAVIVNSSATKKAAKNIFSAGEYPIIPMGVSVENLVPLKKTRAPKNGALRLLFVGRLSPEKGVNYLLDAVDQIVHEGGNVKLTIAGTGPAETELHAKVTRQKLEKNVHFAGWVAHDDYPKLFADADVFVGPSIVTDNGVQEAFGLVFAESLALDTPVIGTATGGITDIVTNGKNGLLVPPRDAPALAAAIEQFIDSPELCDDLSRGARADIEKRFSWSVCIEKYAAILQKVVK